MLMLASYYWQFNGAEGACLVPWVGGPPDASFGFLPTRSIPKPDQHRKDIIQQEALGTDILIWYYIPILGRC